MGTNWRIDGIFLLITITCYWFNRISNSAHLYPIVFKTIVLKRRKILKNTETYCIPENFELQAEFGMEAKQYIDQNSGPKS